MSDSSTAGSPTRVALPDTFSTQRTSSATIIAALAGLLALISVLPMVLLLTKRIAVAEDTHDANVARMLAVAITQWPASDLAEAHTQARAFGVDGIEVVLQPQAFTALGPPMTCDRTSVQFIDTPAVRYAVACSPIDAETAAWVWKRSSTASRAWSMVLVTGVGGVVGIATALGVLQLLAPLTKLPDGLRRLAAGERGVSVSYTGLKEVDAMVDLLNAASRAIEDREDAIRGRIQVVQEIARLVAHEVRNPLQSMELLAELIGEETDAESRSSLATTLRDEIRILESVVARLLREQPGRTLRLSVTKTPVDTLIARVVALRQPEARAAGIELVSGPATGVSLLVDAPLLSRAIENCVANALAFAPPRRGRVEVAATVDEEGTVHFIVDDNGPGVPPDLTDKIFNRDVTRREGGSGLGLVFVRGVATAHGGRAEHEPSPLGGARFRISIPATPDGARQE